MTLDEISRAALDPAMAWLPARMDSPEARVMLLTIAMQESRLQHRFQVVDLNRPWVKGPARSFWQGEKTGGMCYWIFRHPSTKDLAEAACAFRGVPATPDDVWAAIENDDVLAAILARLLLWSDPGRLPLVTQTDAAWSLYVRTWRPGKPKPDTWPGFHRTVRAFMGYP